MVTDTYTMMSDKSMRSMLKSGECNEDLSMLIREQRRQHEASEREKELNIYRSGSAPPTVEGSLNAVGGLFEASSLSGFTKNDSKGFVTEEELRADPAYVNYYYSNLNLNPRLPPPLLSKEDWRFAQRLQGGGGGSAVEDRRIGGEGSLFSVQPGIGGKEETGVPARKGAADLGGCTDLLRIVRGGAERGWRLRESSGCGGELRRWRVREKRTGEERRE